MFFKIFHLSFFSVQEVREMMNLPETKANMLPADFEGIAEALKGMAIKHSHDKHYTCLSGWCL